MKLTIKFYEIKQDLYEIFLFIKGKENYKYGRNKKKKRIRGRQHLPINSIEEFISIFNIARARRPKWVWLRDQKSSVCEDDQKRGLLVGYSYTPTYMSW